jgi:hypothetical protein
MVRGKSLAAAVAMVERWYKAERKGVRDRFRARAPAAAAADHPPELRLILRVFRRRGIDRRFPALVEKLLEARTLAEFLAAVEKDPGRVYVRCSRDSHRSRR